MRCRGEKLHGRRRCPTGHRQLTRSYSEGGPTLGEAERPFSNDRTRRRSGKPQGRGASRRRRGSAEPMAALPLAGMTSEREANPTRGGVRRRAFGSGPFASRCRPRLRRGQQAPRSSGLHFVLLSRAARRKPPGRNAGRLDFGAPHPAARLVCAGETPAEEIDLVPARPFLLPGHGMADQEVQPRTEPALEPCPGVTRRGRLSR